ncbi:MAG: cytidylate kinase-like family protein [Oribacterium sp.]|nr:cytidylate kinase-like family protein [Oribacterium sp.]
MYAGAGNGSSFVEPYRTSDLRMLRSSKGGILIEQLRRMTAMANRIITISREYGANAHWISGQLSERLGLPYYDKDFIRKTAAEHGYDLDTLKKESENISNAFLNHLINITSPVSYKSSYDTIFAAQSQVVLELAKHPCIIVGRCANYILEQAGIPSFDIYLYAEDAWKIRHVKELDLSPEANADPLAYIRRQDQERQHYYKRYTGRDMGRVENYNACLDVGCFGLENTVEVLVDMIQKTRMD